MPHGDLAQLSAVLGGLGAAAMLLSRSRAQLLAGLGLTAVSEGGLAAALIPGRDLKLLVSPPLHLAALVLGILAPSLRRSSRSQGSSRPSHSSSASRTVTCSQETSSARTPTRRTSASPRSSRIRASSAATW